MADRRAASTHRKVPQIRLQQQNRARRLVALVPQPGARSEIDSSSDTSEDELRNYKPAQQSDRSSSAPSLPSSLENLHLLSDSDCEARDKYECNDEPKSTQRALSPMTRIQPSPSPKQVPLSTIRQRANLPRQANGNVPTPLHHPVHSPSSSGLSSHCAASPLAPTSPFSVPSPATATRSKKSKTVVVPKKKKPVKPKPLTPSWKCQKFIGIAEVENQEKFPSEDKTPIEFFKQFITDEMISMIVEQTNLYSTQKKGTSINITQEDIRDFIALNILMGIVNMPAYTDYWSRSFRYGNVADVMTLKKFQMIRRYIHFNDNLHDDGDRYYKIRPFLEAFRQNCLQIEEESRFSVDEMMVPYKGTKAGSRRQYIKNKPKKWGYKVFVRAGVSGLVYDFLVYGGEDTFRYNQFSDEEEGMGLGAKVVLALAKTIREPACKIMCFDNFFTSIELVTHLRNEYGIFSLGTIRQNRLRGAQEKLPTDKNLKKKGRGSHAQVVCNKNKVVVLKWYDNKCVTAASSFVDANPVETIVRYSKEAKARIPVRCPKIIKEYNANMGGVDLADMLIALYRTDLRGHRWHLPLFSQVLDIAINNAWLLYRRGNEEGNQTPLKLFRYEIYKCLLQFERAGTTPKSKNVVPSIIKNPVAERPIEAVRFDQVGHLPQFTSKGRCKYCTKGQTKFFCPKCNVRLCLVENRNCYHLYHSK